MLCVVDCITDCVRLAVPEATERQRIGNQIYAGESRKRARRHYSGQRLAVSHSRHLPPVLRKSWADWSKSEPGAALQWTWEFDALQ
jgi:hypothetical protein